MKRNNKLILLIIFLVGLIIPFIPSLTIIEMLFLLIPFAIIFVVTLIYLFVSLLNKNLNRQRAIFIFSILPIFIFSQLSSGFVVDRVQKFRSMRMINDIQKIKTEKGDYPEKYESKIGIKYRILKDRNKFEISYSRGFMVTEKYDSENEQWKSYGWND